MTILATVAARRQALLDAWIRDPLQQVLAETPSVLSNLVYLDDGEEGAAERLGRRRATSVACVRRPGPPDTNASAWVAAGYRDYRKAYLAFIKEVYGIAATSADLSGFDVDHLLNRARSPQGTCFIRIEAIPGPVNQEWGRLYEKAASAPHFYANQERERRTMSWMVASKLAGLRPPSGPDDRDGIDRLVRYWTSHGFSNEQVRHGITDDLNFVFGRPRGGIVTPTTAWH